MDVLPILTSLRRHKITTLLLVLQIALTCAIVCNAVFLITQRMQRTAIVSGVAENELLRIQVVNMANRPDAKARAQTDLAALRQLAGVTQVSLALQLPFGGSSSNVGLGLSAEQPLSSLTAAQYGGENLLETLGTRLVAGRNLRPDEYLDEDSISRAAAANDGRGLPKVVVISQAVAERLWPGQNPLGRSVYTGRFPLTVVGVVANLVRPNSFELGAQYSVVVPTRLTLNNASNFLIRTAPGDRERVLRAAVVALKAIDPHRVILKQETLEQVRSDFFRDDRAMVGLLAAVCVALLVVTALGIVGLGSFWVQQRRRQIGVRRALGATRSDILRYFQVENFLLATIGIGLGMLLAYAINLALMVQYELPRLPTSYLPIGALMLWAVGQLAVLGPALRASQVPPVVATRAG